MASRWNPRHIGLRQAQQCGDHPHRNRHEHRVHQVHALGVLDFAMLSTMRTDELGVPPLHRGTSEGEFVQLSVHLVFGFLHLEDGRALERPDDAS